MEKIEVSAEGFQKITERIGEIQDKTAKGIVDPSAAAQIIKDVRAELFKLLEIIRNECVIVNDAAGPQGPSAA